LTSITKFGIDILLEAIPISCFLISLNLQPAYFLDRGNTNAAESKVPELSTVTSLEKNWKNFS
jgi:hypothetical protein